MMTIVNARWLKLAGQAARLLVILDTSQMGQEIIGLNDVLVDEKDQKFKLVGIGHVRCNTVEEMAANRHKVLVTLKPLNREDADPVGSLKKT